jgi:hypothetical protein
MLATSSVALAMVETRAAQGCTMDMECKGVRICADGRCVYPPPEAGAQGSARAASAGAAITSAVAAPAPPAAVVAPATGAASVPVAASPSVALLPSSPPAAAAAEIAAFPDGAPPGASRDSSRPSWIRGPRRPFLAEVGGLGFGIYDGNAGALGGGIEAGYRLWRWLGIGAWLEGSENREQKTAPASYRLYDLGLGLTVGETAGPLLADFSVLPELTLTRLSGEGETLGSGTGVTRMGVAAAARLRVGLRSGPWCLFIFVARSYILWEESDTVYIQHVYSGSVMPPRRNVSLGLGLAYLFGADSSNEAIASWPLPGFAE